jgi:hypothetical protein
MRDIIQPDEMFCYPLECHICHATWKAEPEDLSVDRFKTSGYFFDGSAQVAERFYCDCPNGCDREFIPTSQVPPLLAQQVRNRCGME